jgi:hypothetical protein
MVRTTTDDATDAKPATDEAFDIIDEARDVLGDEHVADAMAEYDGDVRLAAADLADAVCDEEDRRMAEAFGVDTDDVEVDVDVTVPDKVDVSGYKTAAGAAKKTAEALREHADSMGYNPDNVVLYDREDQYQGYDAWAVVWEGGPYNWATALTGGESLTAFAGRAGFGSDPEVDGLTSGAGFDVECHFSFDLVFFDR